MSNAGRFGGTVVNNATSDLIVAYNDPANPTQWRYTTLSAGSSSPSVVDIDGFRSSTALGITFHRTILPNVGPHAGWWKIRDLQKAIVKDSSPGLIFDVFAVAPVNIDPDQKSDSDFGYTAGQSKLDPFPP